MLPRTVRSFAFAVVGLPVFAACTDPPGAALPVASAGVTTPIVIAHRGASGARPEHTIEAYLLAIAQGADFIEPDLVATRDGALIARHENALAQVQLTADGAIARVAGRPIVLGATTDIAAKPEFADRLTVKRVDGVRVGGWFSEDLTLAELRTLRARERIPEVRPGSAAFDDRFAIPTLEEILLLLEVVERETGRKVGVYPETKHPTWFAEEGRTWDGAPIGRSLGALLVDTLVRHDFTDPERVYIQSFEVANLIALQDEVLPAASVDLPLVQLFGDTSGCCMPPRSSFSLPYDLHYHVAQGRDLEAIYGELGALVAGGITAETGYGDLTSVGVLRFLAQRYAEGVGPWGDSLLPRERLDAPVDADGDGRAEIATRLTGAASPFLRRAKDAGLVVHPYTLRAEERFRSLDADGRPLSMAEEIGRLLDLGVDGFFTDQPHEGVLARNRWLTAAGGRAAPDRVLGGEAVARIRAAFAAEACARGWRRCAPDPGSAP